MESNEEKVKRIEDTKANRRIAMQRAMESVDPIAAQLKELEIIASPFFLGLDEDADDSDLNVFP